MSLPIKQKTEKSILQRIITKEEILENPAQYEKAISFYRSYPDLLIDLYIQASGPECNFKLFAYQRMLLRALARSKNIFFTFSRGTSKSFIVDLWAFICCILYPNVKIGICASTQQQSGAILEQKVSEILSLLPILKFEVRKLEKIKDKYTIYFKNNSFIQNVAAKNSSRGLRYTGLVLEELIEANPTMIQEVILPTLAIQRRAANGLFDKQEVVTQQKIVVTTAGTKASFAYNTLIRTLLQQLTEKNKARILGGSYKIPILSGLQNIDFIRSQKLSGTFNPNSFAREFKSEWSSGAENAFFSAEIFDKYRSIKDAVFEREERLPSDTDYVFGIDVGRLGDLSEVAVWKYVPSKGAPSTKFLVNLYSFENMHFEEQATEIKRLYMKFHPKAVVLDGAGLGVGLIDYLIKSQIDPETGSFLAPWSVSNDTTGYYNQFKTADCIKDILYIIKATAPFNTEMYTNYQTQLSTGRLRFLTNEREAQLAVQSSRAKRLKDMTEDEKNNLVVPHALTSILRDQMANLVDQREGINIILSRGNKNIKKDKVSASGYALYYIKTMIDDIALRKKSLSLDFFQESMRKCSSSSRRLVSLRTRNGGKNALFQKY